MIEHIPPPANTTPPSHYEQYVDFCFDYDTEVKIRQYMAIVRRIDSLIETLDADTRLQSGDSEFYNNMDKIIEALNKLRNDVINMFRLEELEKP